MKDLIPFPLYISYELQTWQRFDGFKIILLSPELYLWWCHAFYFYWIRKHIKFIPVHGGFGLPQWRLYDGEEHLSSIKASFPRGSVVLFVNVVCFFSHFLYHFLLSVSCGILLKTVAHFVNWDYVVTLKFFLEKQNKGFKTPPYLIQFQSKASSNNKGI